MTAKAPPKRAEAFEWTWRGAHLPGALTRQGTGPHALLIWGEETPPEIGCENGGARRCGRGHADSASAWKTWPARRIRRRCHGGDSRPCIHD